MAALYFHDFTTTGNFRQGSNEDGWNHWINASPRPIVLILTHSLITSSFTYCCHSLNLLKPLSPSSFFSSSSLPLLDSVALDFLFIFCCLLRVPHLVILKRHTLYHSLKSSLIFPPSVITPCPCDCAKTQEWASAFSFLFFFFPFHVQTWLKHTQKLYLQDRVVKQFPPLYRLFCLRCASP